MKNTILAITAIAEATTELIVLAIPLNRRARAVRHRDRRSRHKHESHCRHRTHWLGVACCSGNWVPQVRAPRSGANLGDSRQQLYGMLTYSVLVTLVLIRIGIRVTPAGPLLWPAVIVHAVLIILLVVAGCKARNLTPT